MKKIYYYLVIMITLFVPLTVNAYSTRIIPGGQNLGIEIAGEGVLVVGFYKVDGTYNKGVPDIKIGDYIVAVNDNDVKTIDDFILETEKNEKNNMVTLTINRDGSTLNVVFSLILDDDKYKTGLYVKDRVTGIGTLSYIDPETKIYGALGHEIIEGNTNKRIEVITGNIFNSNVTGIIPSTDGEVGSKNAKIDYYSVLGNIEENTEVGIFGVYDLEIDESKLMDIMPIDEVSLGVATIRTTLDGEEIKDYEIMITKIDKSADIKNIFFKVIDKELLSITGGIVQGMSGSPIIQSNKIIGAVTHVVIDDVKTGYGITIETMLLEGEN